MQKCLCVPLLECVGIRKKSQYLISSSQEVSRGAWDPMLGQVAGTRRFGGTGIAGGSFAFLITYAQSPEAHRGCRLLVVPNQVPRVAGLIGSREIYNPLSIRVILHVLKKLMCSLHHISLAIPSPNPPPALLTLAPYQRCGFCVFKRNLFYRLDLFSFFALAVWDGGGILSLPFSPLIPPFFQKDRPQTLGCYFCADDE